MNRLRFIFIALASLVFSASAQQLTWSVDFRTLFDNREGDDNYNESRTFFQTQLAPEIGLSMMNGIHRISGGVVWTQPIGSSWDGYNIAPTLYYRYDNQRIKFSFGWFPRTQLLQQMPNFLWCDSLNYAQANIRGAMIQYLRNEGFVEAFVDWRGMQSEKVREAFSIQVHGEWSPNNKIFITGAVAMMNHFAKSKHPVEQQFIVDNFIANPWVGLNLSHITPLDSLTLKAGMLMAITRNRRFDVWETPGGLFLDLAAQWKWVGIRNTLYAGKKLFPYYPEFHALLDLGEPFYQSKFYDRAQFYAYLLRTDFMNLEASLDFNFADGCLAFYQRLMLRVQLDSFARAARKSGKKLPLLNNVY